MSMIDDVVGKRFSRGKDFKRGKNTGTFGKELQKAVIESPSLSSLRDNVEGMREVVEHFEKYASGDNITDGMREKMVREFKKNNPNATRVDIESARSIFKHLSKAGKAKDDVAVKKLLVGLPRERQI